MIYLQTGFHSIDFSADMIYLQWTLTHSLTHKTESHDLPTNWFSFHRLLCRQETSLKYHLPPIKDKLCLAYQVEGYVGEPVDRGDDVREENELGLVVSARKFSSLEGVHSGAED